MHQEAALLGELLDATAVRHAVLVGHSDGASIALIHAGSRPHHSLRGLVLEAPHVFTEAHGLASIARIAEDFRRGPLRARLQRLHGANTDGAFWGWNRVWLDPEFASWNIEAFLPEIRVPMLLVQGLEDEYGTWRQIEAIQAQAGGPVRVLPIAGCGHSPHRAHADLVVDAAADFVLGVLRGGGKDAPTPESW